MRLLARIIGRARSFSRTYCIDRDADPPRRPGSGRKTAFLPLTTIALLAAQCARSVVPEFSRQAWNAAMVNATSQGVAGEIGLTDRSTILYLQAGSKPGHRHKTGEIWRWAASQSG
jgi:hypothetical protein